MKNLAIDPDEVDKYISEIKKYKLIELVQELENIINEMAAMREGDDHLLTEVQKKELATLKTKIKAQYSPCDNAINFYNNKNRLLGNSIEIDNKDKKGYGKEAEGIKKELTNLLKTVEKLRKSIPITDL